MTRLENGSFDERSNTFTRSLNVMLGAWLVVSAFVWPHSEISRINTSVSGLLVAVHALAAMKIPPMRWLNTAVGAWVVTGAALLPHLSAASVWNNIIVGLAVLLVSVDGLSPHRAQSPML